MCNPCEDCDDTIKESVLELLNYQGNGKCSECHGEGSTRSLVDRVANDLSGSDEWEAECEVCSGTGVCQTCGGTGCIDED
jgi:hypothetical protein